MKAASIIEIKKELEKRDFDVILDYCLRLSRFKKENKELLSFLLFNAADISSYVENLKQEVDQQFEQINKTNIYFIKKSVRKILRNLNKKIRFSGTKEVEAELLIHFCNNIISHDLPIRKSQQLMNLYEHQFKKIDNALASLHPDLQYDLRRLLLS